MRGRLYWSWWIQGSGSHRKYNRYLLMSAVQMVDTMTAVVVVVGMQPRASVMQQGQALLLLLVKLSTLNNKNPSS
jgi:hypothetical protein